MERERKTKVIAIVALVVAIVGMSLGFAAFSNILTISSSATVTPNEEDFKMKIYGIGVDPSTILMEPGKVPDDLSYYNSDSVSRPILTDTTAVDAVIVNETSTAGKLSIKNLSVNFTEIDSHAVYFFIIKNEGKYNAYLDLSEFEKFYNGVYGKECSAVADATPELVAEACKGITLVADIATSSSAMGGSIIDGTDFSGTYEIAPNDYIYLGLVLSYVGGSAKADGEFLVTFDDISLEFSTVE